MLELLSIRNLAVIEEATLEWKAGLNILSGETGSGKSIVVESIGLLLGGRVSPDLVRSGCEEATIEGVFQLSGEIARLARTRFEEFGYSWNDGEILIKRTIVRTGSRGRNRIFVNGQISTQQILTRLTDGLVDFCGQHDNQTLTRPSDQLELLDRFAKTVQDATECRQLRSTKASLEAELATISSQVHERERQLDYIEFQLQELDRIDPKAGEDEHLQWEKKLLQSSEQRRLAAQNVLAQFEGEERGIFSELRTLHQRLRTLLQIDPDAKVGLERLDSAQSELETLFEQVSRYLSAIDASPERLLEIQERLSQLTDLKRKHGGSLEQALISRESLQARKLELSGTSQRRDALEIEIQEIEKTLLLRETHLRASRSKAATKLSKQIESLLDELRMEDSGFRIEVGKGPDEVSFLIRTNTGEGYHPLSKIASGGELSRVMLAIRSVLTDPSRIGVYLFDEIDAGMGGQTAFVVGRKLQRVAFSNQVICITHLPQVAAFADHQFAVRKQTQRGRTFTEVSALKDSARKQEIARMLGGLSVNGKALSNAEALLKEGQQSRRSS